ncbi:outer membrane protein TolC [Mesoflavibacter sabulilitoris]|uniref:TolC family protein n=1 Tax=Mesoflavibacter zeaxanthinifaciens subsp. sabulilitoris TaxID=1520893 RepID=A0A2T1NF46_9FLAO|nr:TolC family protein [Mesoflavibacter zeaxanthinifaciens]MBB3124847.1 outer membrane protein TolC [Mesoflavibacter zeaxanthinifaciens subsp. sabulilitoris]PSG91063.1 TolC family protein [Mesoflavibacter zeaxanthinifaciens subsp. sabulilitoris]
MKQLIVIFAILITLPSVAQQSITLEQCYQLVIENYPLAKQTQLLDAQNKLDKEVVSTSKLPQLSLDAQATYQSDVIEIPIPNAGIEPLNKDQYRATLSVNQLIYNGGATDATLDLKSAQLKTKQKQVEVSLYQLKQQINQLYFSILLVQESELLLNAKKEQLKVKLKEVQSGIKYGVILPSSDKVLEAELLKLSQQFKELVSNKASLIATLSSLISKPLNDSVVFQNPLVETDLQTELARPELELFQLKKEEITTSENVLSKQNAPKLLGFASGGYGNPGLNMLDNSFQPFYTVGVKLNWNVFDWNSNKKQRESLAINKDIVENETEIFKLNTNIQLNQQQKEIDKIEEFIASDLEIINLRKEVLKSTDSQLKNGVITSSAYITEFTNLYEDENTLVKHKIQLQLAKANYNVIKGQ